MAYLSGLTIKDGANLDAFSRLRVSSPQGLFDAQFTYNLRPTLFEQVASGANATIVHDAHQFIHANSVTTPYIQYATLPVRCGMTCSGTVSTTMRFICSAVISEGGQDDTNGLPFTAEATLTAGNGTETYVMSLRPKTTFSGITNRSKIILESVTTLVTGNNPVKVSACYGQAATGTSYTDVNSTYSSMEVDTAGTLSGSPAIVSQVEYCPSSNTVKGVDDVAITNTLPITLDAAGAVRANGTVTVRAMGIGGTSACRIVAKWRELR